MTATPKWPAGTYGIPRSLSDCPAATGFSWRTGWRYQDTEDFLPSNRHSSNFHLDASVSASTLKRTFCMKTEKAGDALRVGWPKGTYVASKFFQPTQLVRHLGRTKQFTKLQVNCIRLFVSTGLQLKVPSGHPTRRLPRNDRICESLRQKRLMTKLVIF